MIAGIDGREIHLQTGYPHGLVRVFTTASTKIVGPALFIRERVIVTGLGSIESDSGISATQIAESGATPAPSAPPGASTASLMAKASAGKIGLIQIFDQFGSNEIPPGQAQKYAYLYGLVWGDRIGMPKHWTAGNSGITNAYYVPQEGDGDWNCCDGSGGIGHTLSWWQTYHPSWVLYACTADGTPTRDPAFISGLLTNVPLDIHNPDVVTYQVNLAAQYAADQGFQGLAYDEVLFGNVTGNAINSTDYGCGIYENGTFVRRYSGKNDPRWTEDTVAWVEAARPIIASYHLKFVVNHPAGPLNANEEAILQNVDGDLDETGFSDYGNYTHLTSLFQTTVDWMNYAQTHGASPLIIDDFEESSSVSPQQLEYSIATYLMGHDGSSGLFVGNANSYGLFQYHAEYATAVGYPCSSYYQDSTYRQIWYRKFGGVFVAVNSGGADGYAHLPTNHTYRDLEGQKVTNPLLVRNAAGYVLLTTNGCH